MKKRLYTLILPAFLACLGFTTSARAGVCFVVGGDCGELNAVRDIKNCSDLGYSYTSDNCLAPKMKLTGGVCKGNDDVLRYEKCECNPDYYPHSKQAEDAYKYDYSDCCSLNGNICHTRTCKADYKYPAGMTSGIALDGDTCTDGGGTKSKDYKCTISGYGKIGDSDGGFEVITSGGTAQGYTANCYKPKTCAYYNSNYKENGNSPSDNTGYVTVATYPDIKVGKYGSTIYTTTQSKTCYILRTASCGDYGLISGCNSGYEGQNATQKKSGSQNITCYTACIKKCDEGFTTSCSSTYCVQSGECYRPATCDDIDHVVLSGGSYTGNATISSSSTTQNGYTTPSSTYNGSVTYYPKSGLTISGINPSMTESGNVTLKINNQTCYWAQSCQQGQYATADECVNAGNTDGCTQVAGNSCFRPYTCEDVTHYDRSSTPTTSYHSSISLYSSAAAAINAGTYDYSYASTEMPIQCSNCSSFFFIGDKLMSGKANSSDKNFSVNGTQCWHLKNDNACTKGVYVYQNNSGKYVGLSDVTNDSSVYLAGLKILNKCAMLISTNPDDYTGFTIPVERDWHSRHDTRLPTVLEINYINYANYMTGGRIIKKLGWSLPKEGNKTMFTTTNDDDRVKCYWASVESENAIASGRDVVAYTFGNNGLYSRSYTNPDVEEYYAAQPLDSQTARSYCTSNGNFTGVSHEETSGVIVNTNAVTTSDGWRPCLNKIKCLFLEIKDLK